MREEIEIRRARRLLQDSEECRDTVGPRDCFKHGYLLGKLAALNWVLGGPASPVSSHYDYEDYRLELTGVPIEVPPFDPNAPPPTPEQLEEWREIREYLKNDLDMMRDQLEEDSDEGGGK